MIFQSIFSHVTGKWGDKETEQTRSRTVPDVVTQEMLDIGVKALENFQQFESPQANHANPPIEALPLLSKIAQNCYMSAADSESLMKRLPNFARPKDICAKGDTKFKPYVRVWYTKVPPELATVPATSKDPSPIMIIAFTGSTRSQDFIDDIDAFFHLGADFLHGNLGFLSVHRGFANWLSRPLDRSVKDHAWDIAKSGAEAVLGLLDRSHKDHHGKTYETVYSRLVDIIAEIRAELEPRYHLDGGSHALKTFIVGHSLGGAVAAMFGLRVAGIQLKDDQRVDTRPSFLKMFSDPRRPMPTADNPRGLPPDGKLIGGPILYPMLILTFGAPRFLWRADKESQDEFTQYGNLWLEQMPIVRIVNDRDPVPHVPVGKGFRNDGMLIEISAKQKDLKIPDVPIPSSATKNQKIPLAMQDSDKHAYEHIGGQWVLSKGNHDMERMQTPTDAYIAGIRTLLSDTWGHSYEENLVRDHYMDEYIGRVVAVYENTPPEKRQQTGIDPYYLQQQADVGNEGLTNEIEEAEETK